MINKKEPKPKQKTRDELLVLNAALLEKVNEATREDMEIRSQLSEILGCHIIEKDFYSRVINDQKIDIRSWLSIAALIGELKADANYSMVLESKEELRKELEEKAKEIFCLKNKLDKNTIIRSNNNCLPFTDLKPDGWQPRP
jgi:hypothetical protein